MAGMADWQAQITIDVDDLKKRIKAAEGELDGLVEKDYKVKLDLDTKTLESAVKKLDKMLDSIGKGSSDFKQFENLSKQLSSITTDIDKISKAFTAMDDGSGLVNNIKSIDTSLTNLTNHFVSQVSNKMTSSIKEVKGTLSDVGNGKELEPLLQTIGKIESAIDKLSSSLKGIGLNMNIDFGSDKEMGSKAEAKIANALQAYQRLFDHIKQSSAGGSIINQKFFDFDINQYDTAMSKLQAYRKFIDNIRKETKSQFNGKDVLYEDTDKKYWTQASSAMGQVTKVFNEIKAASDTNTLENIFGKTDLTEVLNQLTAIVSKLDEISVSANKFSDVFKDGLNVNASVEEIDKLTNRIKELESELAKVKTVGGVESNTSLGDSSTVQKTTDAIKEQNTVLAENSNKIRESISELTKGRDILSQQWYKEKGTVVEKDSKGNNITRDVDQFSFVERLQNGQIQTVVATLDEKTGKWVEQIINARTAFEQVEKAIISADNKINSLENDRDKTLASHPGYDTSADNALIESEKNRRAELQKTLDLYATEKEYVYQIEAANKRIAENQQRLANVSAKKENLRNAISDEQFNKDWDAAIAENNKRDAEQAKQQAKAQLEIDKQLAKEEENVSKAQQKKAQAFLKEQANYEEEQKKAEFIKKQTAAYDELTNTISKYSEVSKRVASGKAEDDDLELMTKLEDKISQLQKQPILSDSQVAKSEKSLVSLYNQLDKIEKKLVETNQKSQDKQISGFDKRIDGYDKKLTSYQATASKFKDGGWTSDTYTQNIDQLNTSITNYKNLLAEVQNKGIASDEDIKNLNQYESEIQQVISTVSNMSAAEKGFTFLSGQKELDKINSILTENSAMSRDAKAQIRAYYAEIKSGNPSASLDVIHAKIMEIVNAEAEAGRTGKSMFDAIKEKAWYGVASAVGTYFGFNDVLRYGGEVVNTVKDLNTQITELAKVSEQSSKQIYTDFDSYADIAKEVRGTISDTIAATADWSKNGYGIPDAKELAEVSQLYKNVGDGINIDEANESLISTLKGFKLEADEAEHIVDVFNEVSKHIGEVA